jgi:hypothetical protein
MTVVRDVVEKVEVGTIFVSSWGYDQTNIDFYKVLVFLSVKSLSSQ